MAVRLDASGDRLNRTTSLPTYNACTIMGWFKISVDRDTETTFIQLDSASTKFIVATNSGGLRLQVYNGVSTALGSTPTLNTWFHLAMVVNGTSTGNFLTYYNGALDITYDANSGTSTDLILGNSDDPGVAEWLNGCIAAVKVYDAVLVAAEIAQEMRQYMPFRTASLNSFYPLLSIADDEIDFSGNGRTLTVSGTLATEAGPPIAWRQGRRKIIHIPAAGGGPTAFPHHYYAQQRAA